MRVVNLAPQFFGARLGQGERDRTVAFKASVLTCLALKALHEIETISGKRTHDRNGLGFTHKTGRMPGRATGQFLAFKKRNGPARSRQMISCRTADDPSADNGNLDVR